MTVQDELRRIRSGPAHSEAAVGAGAFVLRGICPGNAAEVSGRIREVLHTVIGSIAHKPTEGEWLDRLPHWLKREFVPAMSQAEAAQWLARWESMTAREKAAEDHNAHWALEDWLYWFEPEQRHWEFWDCRAISEDLVRLSITPEDWPFAHAALDWLIRVAGATKVFEEE